MRRRLQRTKEYIVEIDLSARSVILIGVGVLLLSYLGVVVIDILNLFGMRELFSGRTVPAFWDFMFSERGPVEILQWLFLLSFTATSGYMAKKLKEEDGNGRYMFWLLFSVGGVFMLLEDATNIRHFLIRGADLPWVIMNIIETVYFGILALPLVVAVLKYGGCVKDDISVKLLVLAFVFYGSAAFLSGPLEATDYDWEVGDVMYGLMVRGGGDELEGLYEEADMRIEEMERKSDIIMMDVRTRLVDFLLEESLELLGTTMLLGVGISYKNKVDF